MADPQDEKKILISVEVQGNIDAISKATVEVQKLKDQNKELSKSYAENSQTIEINKATIKNLNTEISQKQKIIQAEIKDTTTASGAYAKLSLEYSLAAQKAKDISIAYGSESEQAKKASKEANNLNEILKKTDTTVGQSTRHVGGYSEAIEKAEGKMSAFKEILVAGGVIEGLNLLKEGFMKVVESTKGTADEFKFAMAGLQAGVTQFFASIATGDWGNLLGKMNDAIKAGEAYAKILDEIQEGNQAIRIQISEMNLLNAQDARIYRDATKTRTERVEAIDRIIEREKKLADTKTELSQKDLDNELSLASQRSGLTDEEIKNYATTFNANEKLRKQAEAFAKEKHIQQGINNDVTDQQIINLLQTKQSTYDYYLTMQKMNKLNDSGAGSFDNLTAAIAKMDEANTEALTSTQRAAAKRGAMLAEIGKTAEIERKNSETKAEKDAADEEKRRKEATKLQIELDKTRIEALSLIQNDYQKQQDDVFEKYQKAIDLTKKNTNLTTAEIKFYTISLQNQMMDEINSIKSKAIDDQNAHNLKVLDKENAIELAKYSDNARKILEIQLKIANKAQEKLLNTKTDGSKEQIDEKKKVLIEGENKINGIKKQLSDLDQSTQLISVYNNEEAQYQIKLKYLNEYLKKIKGNKDEQAKVENEITLLKAEHLKKQISTFSQYADDILNISGSLNTVIKNGEDAKLTDAENRNTKQASMLNARLKAGVITQKQYDDQIARSTQKLDAEKLKIAIAQAKRDKITNTLSVIASTAKAIAEAWAASPTTFGLPWSALAAGMGIAQEAAIATAPLPKASTGGLIGGKKHSQGGTIIEAEMGESIITAKSTSMFAPLLSAINQIGGGVPIGNKDNNMFDGGFSIRNSLSSSNNSNTDLINEIKNMKIVATIEDIKKADKNYMKIQSNGTV